MFLGLIKDVRFSENKAGIKYIYNILINGLINLQDSYEITKQLFLEHSDYLKETVVKF